MPSTNSSPAKTRVANRDRRRVASRGLQKWLEAEQCDDEAVAERALFDLLSKLPETLADEQHQSPLGPVRSAEDDSRVRHVVLSIGAATEGFAERLVERLEREARRGQAVSFKQWALAGAASLLACWLGAMVYAALLGVSPGASSSLFGAVQFLVAALADASRGLVSVLAGTADLLTSLSTVRSWAYSPWLMVAASSALMAAGLALIWLERLLPKPMVLSSSRNASSAAGVA